MFYFYKSHLYPTELPRKYNERIVAHLKQDYPNVNDFERAFWYIASGDWKYAKTYYFK
ncbi:MAG: hypothetical protein ACREHG_10130 [Candidatus Saccharimonadales bacterium]